MRKQATYTHQSQFLEMFGNENTLPFSELAFDDTKSATKIPASEYHDDGRVPIYDQSQDNIIAGFTDNIYGICMDYPAILFGDHSRVFKYIDNPFFIGADGVKIIRSKNINTKFLYYALRFSKIPNTGYNRHFKWVKELNLPSPPIDKIESFIAIARQADKSKFDGFKSQFLEMFGCAKYGWKYPTYKLSSRYKIGTGGTPDRKKGDFYGGEIPWVKSTEVNFNEVWSTEESLNENGLSNSNCKLYDAGAILLAMYGQGATRGRVAKLCIPATVNQAIAVIQVDLPHLSEFIYNSLKVNYEEIRDMAVGGNQHNLNLNLVGQIEIPDASLEKIESFNSCSRQADKSKYYELN